MSNDKKLLVVDDEVESSENIADFFNRLGYEVSLANGGKEAISILEKNFFSVVLLDIKMPDLDGEEVLKFIKQKHPNSKVIVITGLDEGKSKKEFLKIGVHDYILKPINLSELAKMLDRLYK